MTFQVGQKVVCIKRGAWQGGFGDEINPEYGKVYTVRDVVHWPRHTAVRLFEIKNDPRDYSEAFNECDFHVRHFRPVVSRKTSIEIFTRMLNPSKQGIDA